MDADRWTSRWTIIDMLGGLIWMWQRQQTNARGACVEAPLPELCHGVVELVQLNASTPAKEHHNMRAVLNPSSIPMKRYRRHVRNWFQEPGTASQKLIIYRMLHQLWQLFIDLLVALAGASCVTSNDIPLLTLACNC